MQVVFREEQEEQRPRARCRGAVPKGTNPARAAQPLPALVARAQQGPRRVRRCPVLLPSPSQPLDPAFTFEALLDGRPVQEHGKKTLSGWHTAADLVEAFLLSCQAWVLTGYPLGLVVLVDVS